MKIAKKSLSLFLSLLMIYTACSVGFAGLDFTAYAATGTVQSVKNALTDDVVNEIVYKGHLEYNSYTYKGDAAVAVAADEIYAYAISLKEANANTAHEGMASTAQVNATSTLLAKVAANTGFTSGDKYLALQYILDPPGDTVTGIEQVTPVNGGKCNGCDHKYVYNTIPTDKTQKTVKVYGTVSSLLEKYNSVDDIPVSLLQGVTFTYSMVADQACLDQNYSSKNCDYDCMGYRWNYLSSLKRTEIKNIVSIDELKEFGKVLASEDLSMTFDEMIALPASELEAIYNENYAPYQAMIDKYTFANVDKLFGSYNQYFRDLLKAMQINLSLPAIDILMDKVGTEYDSENYDEMAAIYAPANSAYNAIKGYGSEVFDYIKTKAEYADFDIAAAKEYLNDMKKAMDLITLPGLKATIDADLAAYNGVNLNTLDIPVLKTLLNKLNGYKGTIGAANQTAVSSVMGTTVNNLNNLINSVKANIEARSPAETEAAFNVQYNYYTPVLFGNYSAMATADVMTMYSDYDVNREALIAVYNEQVTKYGAAVVNPLFSVTIGEGGSPALIQNVISKNSIQTELVARNSAQIAIAAGYKDMAANVNFDNLVIVSTAVKNFDQALYQLCADNGWVSAADQALYSDVQAVINAYNAFVNKINTSGFQKVELDENGVYVVRDVMDEDLVKEDAYTVDEAKINDTIVKLDNFLASEDFGALLGFEDADGNAVGLGDYLYGMLGEMLFNNDLINMVIGMLFPMIEDLLVTELSNLLNSEDVNPNKIPPQNPGAVGYVDLSALVDQISGGIDVYLGDVTKEGQERIQMSFAELLKSAGLYIFPSTLADSMVSSGVLTTSSEAHKMLKAAGNSWTALGVFDPETETFTYNLNLDWGITDRASFTKVLGGVLDSVGSLLPTLFLNQAFDKTLGSADNPAGVGYGSISAISIVNINNAEFYASLSLAVQPLNLYANLFQPLFSLLGLTANANLTTSSNGIDYAKAILDPIFSLLDKVVAAPLDTILGLLPNLAYILSTDFIDSFLGSILLDFSVKLGIAGSNASGLFGTLLNWLGDSLSFEVFADQMGIADIAGAATLKDLVGIDISNINSLLDFLFESLEVDLDLPDIDQTGLIECAKWNSKNSLTADKADVLFFLLDYLVSALNPEFLNAIIGMVGGEDGGLDLEGTLGTVLNKVFGSIADDPDDAIAALVELLNPVEYELKEMTWAEGADESIVYLHYANDWTKSESQYLIDNAMDIVKAVLGMTGSDAMPEDINAFLKEKVDGLLGGLFTNETITKLVETFAGIELPEILSDILVDQLGVNMGAWANDFGYLFNEELEAPDATVLGVTAVKDSEGNIVWNGLADGDKAVFVDTLCAVLAPLAPAVAFLLGGEDLGVFGIVELKGYESFDSTLGLLLETLGVTVPAVNFAADPMGSLNSVINAVFTWLDATLASDALVETAINLITNLIRYIESNGLSVLLHNLLLPVLALVDTVRPLINVDVNTILSVIVSDLVAGNELDMDKVLGLVLGTYEGNDDITVTVTIDNLTLTKVLGIVDAMFGSDLVHSSFATIGLKGLCNADVDAADALTIILSSLIDALGQPAADTTKTNADAIFGYIAEKTENDQIGNIVNAVLELIGVVVYEYDQPDWDKIFTIEFNAENADPDLYLTVDAKPSIEYLSYANDWTEDAAKGVYASLDEILNLLLPSLLGENETIAAFINGMLEEKVYSDEILNTLIEAVVNLLAGLDASLFETVDVVLDTDIATWFTFCTLNEETGKYECTKAWGVDEAEDKGEAFVDALKEALAPANRLLAFLFFGDSYEFFTDSEVDANGNYTYKSLITLNGGEGYAKGLVPIFEALGLTMKPASAYLVNGEYDAVAAVADILNAVLGLVDSLATAESTVAKVFDLLPNLIYFLNVDGIKASVNNILAPVNGILEKVAAISEDIPASITDLIPDGTLPIDITNLTTEELLGLGADAGLTLSDEMLNIVKNLYVGKLEKFTSVNGDYAYRLNVEGYEHDVLTIVLSLAVELFTTNKELFGGLLDEKLYDAIVTLVGGLEVTFSEIHWGYMYEDEATDINAAIEKLRAEGFGEPTINKLGYSKDWTDAAATGVYSALDDILAMVFDSVDSLKGKNVATLVNGILEDNVYSDAVVNSVISLIVNAVKDFEDIIKNVDAVLGVELDGWFYNYITGTDAEENYICEYDWGIDEAEDKETAFINAIITVLEPANPLLNWLFFGGKYEFLSSSTGETLITLNGGEGYAYGLAPIFEALGLEMAPARAYANVTDAIVDILAKALAFVDELAAADSLVAKVFELLPNLIYFINAGGAKTAVNNLLAPAKVILDTLDPAIDADLSLEGLLGGLVEGFDILNITTDALLDLAEANGVVLSDALKDVVKTLAVGVPAEFTAANGKQAFRVDVTDYEHDVLTIILTLALEVFKSNEALFAGIIKDEAVYDAILTLMKGYENDFVYSNLNWGYMYDDNTVPADGKLPARVEGDIFSNYTKYQNNWNEDVAAVLDENLEAIVDGVMALVKGADADLGQLLEDAIVGGLYQDSILNSLIKMAVGFLVEYEDIIKGAGAVIGAEGLAAWFDDYCDIAEDGTVTCEYDWGIDAAETAEAKRVAFVNAFAEALAPANRLLAWLLFGEDFEFFTGVDNNVIITIKGGEGYNYALVPLLEAFGVEAENAETFYVNGVLDMTKAVTSIFGKLTERIAYICNGVNEDNTSVTVTEAFDLLPNLIYFINAGGLKVVVNNLLAPVQFILDTLEPMGLSVDFATLIEGIDITNLDLAAVFAILEEQLGIVVPAELQNFLTGFYIGKLEKETSANGLPAYTMVYTEEETRIDFITVLISLVADVFTSEANAAKVKELIGDDVYTVLMRYLADADKKVVDVLEFSWQYTDKADTGEVISPVVADNALYDYVYGDLYTREQAEYINKWLPEFIDTTITLIGYQNANGENVESIEGLLNDLIGTSIYTTDNLVALADTLKGLVGQLKELLGDDLFAQAAAILNASLGVDVTVWDNYTVAEIATGDRDAFVAQLVEMLKPVNPILEWLFTSKDLAFFSDIEGENYVVIEGADGYAYGIIPLLEALGCEGVLTPAEYAADTDGLLLNILNPLLNKIDAILADPVAGLLETLPGLIYFINSNGVNTVLNNALRAVFTVLANLEPLVDVDLYELVGIDSADLGSFDALVDMLLGLVTEGTGLELKAVAMNALNELTMGTIVSFESKNGDTAYTMKLATGADQIDFVTIILRLVLNFVSIPENVEALEVLLADSLSEEGYIFLTSLLENFSQMAATEDGMDAILYTVYQIFYTANVAVHETEDFMGELNDDYTFLGNLFATSDLDFIKNIGASLGGLLDNFQNGDIIGSEGVAQNGLMKFFQAIKDFFQKIADFFRNLFS
ncbi:MAG: hypothetical protein IKL10_07050 [Clostridia bacterium]|nr:hypothetical protein [Clostridia bacterium]